MPKTVLVIDDEPDLLRLLDYNLTRADYLVLTAGDGSAGLAMARQHAPDLIVLDLLMPGMDGLEVCRKLRADPATASIPILMLTAKAEEVDKVVGLEMGADDYVTKPFSIQELMARIKAILRRRESPGPPEQVTSGPLRIDAGRYTAAIGSRSLELTRTEFEILRTLASAPGRVFRREALLERARGQDAEALERTVDVHIVALRRKLGRYAGRIETVRGVGYRWKEEE